MKIDDAYGEGKREAGFVFWIGIIIMIWYPLYGVIIASIGIIGVILIFLLYMYLVSQ